jgi:aspartyl-tRNA(Asn)/glutamyl-tRNA(Gln) amidotransferase subunit A
MVAAADRGPRAATLPALADALQQGAVTSRELTERCLANILDAGGEGARTFLHVDSANALAQADSVDAARREGRDPGRLAGIPVSVKDLFDIAGQVTAAGSRALEDGEAARHDSEAVARLKRAGLIVIGRTNMTEFAYSGLGINPHYGTPLNPWRRWEARIPGGSSSGAAISVTDGMAHAALGTDTGGSCRIPAALTGLAGYKPTRLPALMRGAVPLAPSLDAAGFIARTTACCRELALLSGIDCAARAGRRQPVLAVPQALVLDNLDATVALSFSRALDRLSRSGMRILEVPLPELARMPHINAKGGLPAAESFHWHRGLLADKGTLYDPRVRKRIERGREQSAADYLDLLAARDAMSAAVGAALEDCDALVLPAVAMAAPRLADLAGEAAHQKANALALRNTSLVNFFDGCAISLPMHELDDAPAGLMLACKPGDDGLLLALAALVEGALVLGSVDRQRVSW